MGLLSVCVCGAWRGRRVEVRGVRAIVCDECGTGRQVTELSRADCEEQYRGQYHRSRDRHDGCTPYAERYDHDRRVAATRWRRYVELVPRLARIRTSLDVGAANGAFANYLASLGVLARGIDPDPDMAGERVSTATLREASGAYDLVTMHDVLEHTVAPDVELMRASGLVAPGGALVVDVPDVWRGAGDHHWKAEHLWYFSEPELVRLVEQVGLRVVARDAPIPGKMVVYAESPRG